MAFLSFERSTFRSTRSLFLSSCSQILITFHPIARRARPTFRSRSMFRLIFAFQKARLVTGRERQRQHPCQKHPSTNIATRRRMKKTSGLPGRSESCPIRQPLMPDRIRSDRNLHSVVFVPRDLLRLITRERVTASNLSNDHDLQVNTVESRTALYRSRQDLLLKSRRVTPDELRWERVAD
jgi:hypothetical protein